MLLLVGLNRVEGGGYSPLSSDSDREAFGSKDDPVVVTSGDEGWSSEISFGPEQRRPPLMMVLTSEEEEEGEEPFQAGQRVAPNDSIDYFSSSQSPSHDDALEGTASEQEDPLNDSIVDSQPYEWRQAALQRSYSAPEITLVPATPENPNNDSIIDSSPVGGCTDYFCNDDSADEQFEAMAIRLAEQAEGTRVRAQGDVRAQAESDESSGTDDTQEASQSEEESDNDSWGVLTQSNPIELPERPPAPYPLPRYRTLSGTLAEKVRTGDTPSPTIKGLSPISPIRLNGKPSPVANQRTPSVSAAGDKDSQIDPEERMRELAKRTRLALAENA